METNEITMQEAFEELKNDLESGKPISIGSYKVRANLPMSKAEFIHIRKEMDLTQAQLAEVLDISIKTVQSYEQGRIEPPGLVSKVLRLLRSNANFRAVFQGELDPTNYSDSADVQYVSQNGELQQVHEEIIAAVSKLNTIIQIQSITGNSDSMEITNPQPCEV